jgi:hypothetical protein
MALADAFVGLPIESLILDPLLSAAKGQAALAQVTLDFLEALAFEENDGKDNSRKTKLLEIDLDRLANKPDGSMTHLSQKVQMPLLPLVTIPNFSLDTMEIDFMMEVKTSESSSSKDSSSDTSSSSVGTDTSASLSYGFWGVKGSVSTSVQTENKTSGTVSSSKDTQRSSDQSAKYHINVKAKQNEPAEGMAKFTQILSSIIEPITVTQAENPAA